MKSRTPPRSRFDTGADNGRNRPYRIKISDIKALENIGPVEISSNREPCRWTQDAIRFSIFVAVQRDSALELALECSAGSSDFNWKNVFVECDDVMTLCAYRLDRGRRLLSTQLPPRPGATGAILRFYLQETRQWQQPEQAGDTPGRVGLCLTGLRICDAGLQDGAQDTDLKAAPTF